MTRAERPWLQQPDESPSAWQAFELYASLEGRERTVQETARRLTRHRHRIGVCAQVLRRAGRRGV